MYEENEKEWILEAINHLKHRKARPDLSRISLRMKRKYLMSFAQTRKLLDSLIESGIVVKAVYKNNTSYRDVSKWKKGRLGGQILNSSKMLKRFIRAIDSLEKIKGTGVSAQDIEDYLASQGEEKCFLSGAALRDALENEISNGYLKKCSNGPLIQYTINKENPDCDSVLHLLDEDSIELSPVKGIDCNLSSDEGSLISDVLLAINETERSEGIGSSFLDIKEVLSARDVSFNDDAFLTEFLEDEVKKGTLNKNVQDMIHFYAINKKHSKQQGIEPSKEDQVNCDNEIIHGNHGKDNVKSNETCMLTLDSVSVKTKKEINVGDTHIVPLRPPSKRKRIMKDHGPDFEIEMPTKVKAKLLSDNKESIYPTPTDSPASEKSDTSIYQSFNFDKKKRGRPKKNSSPPSSGNNSIDQLEEDSRHGTLSEASNACVEEVEESISTSMYPDVSNWTSIQVSTYFTSKGYVEEAQNMLEHDLDGTALGLLRRSDIVGPPLGGILKVKKLGTALKLFRDIRDLLYHGHAENYFDPYEEKPFLRS
ncbi:hypothetical protein Btru_014368 [Bulinus truncatus]|nr:hypothetical protein Btru_014368 [Bulinus truncatus]